MKIMFYYPLPINSNANAASGIRPLRMLEAFQDLGCGIEMIVGYPKDRKKQIIKVKENIKNGIKYDFMYAENLTLPTIITDMYNSPFHSLIELNFFRFIKSQKIPIGLFYRDIYWRFPKYLKRRHPIKRVLFKTAHLFELYVYSKTLSVLYLPSLKMANYIPGISLSIVKTLPPGHVSPTIKENKITDSLKLFYVGGVTNHYKLHKLFNVLNTIPKISFTLCTRLDEWNSVKNEYKLSSNIRIIHEIGEKMEAYLIDADIAILFIEPQEYWDFAVPFKLFEYIGFNKPIIASNKTFAGEFVAENGLGWSIDYNEVALKNLLDRLQNNREEVNKVKENIRLISPSHSWKARAKQVIKDLWTK